MPKEEQRGNYPEQKKRIEDLIAAAGVDPREVAARSKTKWETFRKYLGGYNKCGQSTMHAIELAVELIMQSRKTAADVADALSDDSDLRPVIEQIAMLRESAPADYQAITRMTRGMIAGSNVASKSTRN